MLLLRNLTGYQFGIYWTIHVSKALASSNGNDCITLSIKNIDYKKMGKSNDQCHFCKNEIESLKFRTSGFLILIFMLLLSLFLKFVVTIDSLWILL
jgi:hypothetical protein